MLKVNKLLCNFEPIIVWIVNTGPQLQYIQVLAPIIFPK